MKEIIVDLKDSLKALCIGMSMAFKWYRLTINEEEKIYIKILYMILAIIDIILIPLKAIIVAVGMATSNRFKEVMYELYDDIEYDLRR